MVASRNAGMSYGDWRCKRLDKYRLRDLRKNSSTINNMIAFRSVLGQEFVESIARDVQQRRLKGLEPFLLIFLLLAYHITISSLCQSAL